MRAFWSVGMSAASGDDTISHVVADRLCDMVRATDTVGWRDFCAQYGLCPRRSVRVLTDKTVVAAPEGHLASGLVVSNGECVWDPVNTNKQRIIRSIDVCWTYIPSMEDVFK